MKKIWWFVFVMVLFFAHSGFALMDSPLVSPNYRIDESFVGGSGLTEEQSSNFKVGESIGDTGIGNSTSTNYQIQSGYTTTSDPTLSFIVDTTSINFGALSTATTQTATSTFHVINYTSYGYVVTTLGNPPNTGGYTLTGLSSQTASQVGVEQYGINLKANTSPISFGANPSGGFGVAASGYDTANQYKYVAGDTIASAPKTSAQTDFTISYIVNAASTTAGGSYTGTQTLVCTGTY